MISNQRINENCQVKFEKSRLVVEINENYIAKENLKFIKVTFMATGFFIIFIVIIVLIFKSRFDTLNILRISGYISLLFLILLIPGLLIEYITKKNSVIQIIFEESVQQIKKIRIYPRAKIFYQISFSDLDSFEFISCEYDWTLVMKIRHQNSKRVKLKTIITSNIQSELRNLGVILAKCMKKKLYKKYTSKKINEVPLDG